MATSLHQHRLAPLARRASLASGTLAILAAAVTSVATLTPCTAQAQGKSPIQAAPPNVLLLVDTSGSMERMPNGSMPVCTPGVAGQDPNRWGSIMQGLTGSMQPFWSCGRMHRDGTAPTGDDMRRSAFLNAYWDSGLVGPVATQAKYDDGYGLPHHRPVSGSTADNDVCALFPDQSAGAMPAFASRYFDPERLATYPWKPNGSGDYNFPNGESNNWANPDLNTPGNRCLLRQGDDGQLDTAAQFARFGVMTFDNDTNPGTGLTMSGTSTWPALGPAPGLNLLPPGLNLDIGGQWTFLYSNSVAATTALGVSETSKSALFPLLGRVTGCATDIPMFVGARNEHAPSWEGPFVGFPKHDITQSELIAHNTNVQSAIMAVRPYGGTPIAGMMAGAYDYLLRWNAANHHGLNDPLPAPSLDPYVAGGCRQQYVVLLTDGAPNLDLRSQQLCAAGQGIQDEGTTYTAGAANCPFFEPKRTAARLRSDSPNPLNPITTFVVGFAVGHDTTTTSTVANDGFPVPVATQTCAEWRTSAGSAANLVTECTNQKATVVGGGGLAAWESTSARACCELNDIALAGDPGRGAYFAESQADLVRVFADILGAIAKQSATRAVPAYSSATTIGTGASAITQSASFVPSFQADPTRNAATQGTGSANIWTGQVQRTRSVCSGGATVDQPISQALGDDFQSNLQQNLDRTRFFVTAVPEKIGGHVDGQESIRPYIGSFNDGIVKRGGEETLLTKTDLANATSFRNAMTGLSGSELGDLFDVSKNTCKASTLSGGVRLAKLSDETNCARVMWGFATAATPTDLPDSSFGVSGAYAARCPIGGGTGQTADVKACRSLGAIIHSTPTIVGAPVALLRDEGYRKYSDLFANRRQTMYVETTDGLLHAFDANYPGRGGSTTTSELWAFIPPAILPELQTNFPGGQRALLDNSPVVKDVVFERAAADVGKDAPWHTVLVAGLGHDGYFALDVSGDGQINAPSNYVPVTNGSLTTLNTTVLRPGTGSPVGPHFLWQLTTTESNGGSDKGKKKKKGKKNKNNVELYGLFGDRVGTPVITTLFINDPSDPTGDGRAHEVGVAILPGGIDDDVPSTTSAPNCPRRTSSLPTFSGPEAVMNPRATVRGWGTACNSPVAGRSVTIVRLDNGRIIRHFARATGADDDVPRRLLGGGDSAVCSGAGACRVINSPLDAPITGTPVVFPNDPGSIAQKMFVGDADGTVYRFDLSNENPSLWKTELFLDTRGSAFPSGDFTGDKPIVVPPVVSLGEKGSLVINVANGDQEDLGAKPVSDHNLLWSVTELPGATVKPQLNWYLNFAGGERVTGPMAVFDKALYFSTYRTSTTANVCLDGEARIYGIDYVKPQNAGNLAQGGFFRIPALPTNIQYTAEGADLIPGVSVRASQACAQAQPVNDYFGGSRTGAMLTTPTSYTLVANKSKSSGAPGVAVEQVTKALALPRTQTIVDSWASVVE